MKIAIVGMMGSGKTELGRILSTKMSLDCVDLDNNIEQSNHMTVVDIFKDYGEGRFREMETNALAVLATSTRDFVLCCGGGVVLSNKNRDILRQHFITVWLDVPLKELERRLMEQRSGRPLLLEVSWKEKLETLYDSRYALYETSAHIRYKWQNEHSAEESALEIEKLIRAHSILAHLQE